MKDNNDAPENIPIKPPQFAKKSMVLYNSDRLFAVNLDVLKCIFNLESCELKCQNFMSIL